MAFGDLGNTFTSDSFSLNASIPKGPSWYFSPSVPPLPDRPFNALFYRILPSRWHRIFPFYFEIVSGNVKEDISLGGGSKKFSDALPTKVFGVDASQGFNPKAKTPAPASGAKMQFFLPIPPQMMTVQHVPATEATATIGGVVEETTAPVFWTITMVGTTGMSIGTDGLATKDCSIEMNTYQREEMSALTGQDNVLGRWSAKVVSNILDDATNILTLNPEVPLPFSRFGTAVRTPDSKKETVSYGTSEMPLTPTGTSKESVGAQVAKKVLSTATGGMYSSPTMPHMFMNGYSWDHALRQFFLIYQRERSMNSALNLYFVDVKSNTRYRCIPRSLQFTKTAQDPHTTTYTIVLKCWDLRSADLFMGGKTFSAIDRFSGDLKEVYTVNATAVYSKMKKVWAQSASKKKLGDYAFGGAGQAAKGSYFG